MADVEIKYNNTTIASLNDSGTEVLETNGTYLTDDITVEYTKSGSGGGLVYEEGTYEPTADASSSSISFANVHTERPFYVCIYDTTGDLAPTDSVLYWEICSVVDLYGTIRTATNGSLYGQIKGFRKTSTNVTVMNTSIGSESGVASYLTLSGFNAGVGSSYYFRANRTYKWIAVWKPTA